MKLGSQTILIILLIVSVSFNVYLYFFPQKQLSNTVVTVIDGDTFTLNNGERVKLLGVNAPEEGRCMSEEATQYLSSLILNKPIRFAEEKRDNYGRRMGLVYVDDRLINTELIRSGLAKPDYTKNSQKNEFIDAYLEAKVNNRGIHATCKISNPLPENKHCTIKGNIDQATGNKFYHLKTCSHYQQIVLDTSTEEQFFCSETQAIEAGFYKSCRMSVMLTTDK